MFKNSDRAFPINQKIKESKLVDSDVADGIKVNSPSTKNN